MSERIALAISTRVPWRALALAALLSALIGAVLLELQREDAGVPAASLASTQAQAPAARGLLSLPLAARATVSRAIGASDAAYHFDATSEAGLRGSNPAQRMGISLDRYGAHVNARGVLVGLGLRAFGYGDSLRTLATVEPQGEANRVTYAHAGISEWYLNGPLGLEQGFTLAHAPPALARGPLTLAIAVTGDGRAVLAPGAQGARFYGAHGGMLRYAGLSASDADGRALHSWLALAGGKLLLRVDARGARFPIRIDPTLETPPRETPEATLSPPSSEEGERAGLSVALSADGTTALVGAAGRDTAGGVAWVFVHSGSTWEEQEELKSPEVQAGSLRGCSEEEAGGEEGECGFGRSVAISADGDTALIGAPRENSEKGAAWIFTRVGSTWTERAELINPKAGQIGDFGISVALSGDGETALVGAPGDFADKGEAWIFTGSGSNWTAQGESLAGAEEVGEGRFGVRVALSGDGDFALIGAPDDNDSEGAAWIFQKTPAGWSEEGPELTGGEEEQGSGRFGGGVALSHDGSTAIVGAPGDEEDLGGAWVFTRAGEVWSQQGPKLAGLHEGKERFGYSVALTANGNNEVAVIGAPRSRSGRGMAWVLERAGKTWSLVKQLEGEEEGKSLGKGLFGASVAVSSEDRVVVVGGPHAIPPDGAEKSGSVWVFGPAPSVDSVMPQSGPQAGGTTVTIEGEHLLAATEVLFGATAATHFEAISEEVITAVSPPGMGVVPITVKTPIGTSAANNSDAFTYRPPPPPPPPGKPGRKREGSTGGTSAGSSSSTQTAVASEQVLALGPIAGGTCGASLISKRVGVHTHSVALFRLLGTGAGSCSGKLRLRVKIKLAGKRFALKTIGTAVFSIASGKRVDVKVKLNAAGRSVLAAGHGKLNGSLLIVKSSPTPKRARTASVRLTLARVRKPKR